MSHVHTWDLSTNPTKVAVIVAGGRGLRMGVDTPKQFLELKGRPILIHTLETFLLSYPDMQIVLVLPADHLDQGKKMTADLPGKERIRFTTGGETRFHSVQNGLRTLTQPAIVFVHDAVRCLLTVSLIRRCFEQACLLGSAIPVIPATDSIRLMEGEQSRALPRAQIRIVQTPQTFRSDILLPAYETPYRTDFTDEASVVEHRGIPVRLIEGEERNRKITEPIDLLIAAEYLHTS
ncbi:MAG: 2-C-methyl-D-erythritol 4-phosphate cytidylyltransferase [Bacteroidetes bacterium]|nr:2-C-methyl-D-erythritol 4-phosphate cytidylyltransferase [Bacteroidota bacterium]